MKKSELDPTIRLDRNNWALSLICHKGSNHAEIIIEKITDDYKYVMQITHFRGIPAFTVLADNRGKVIPPKDISPTDLKYDGKKTWSVTKVNVEKMIYWIKSEHDEQKKAESQSYSLFSVDEKDRRTEFNIMGKHSFLPASLEESIDLVMPLTDSSDERFIQAFTRSLSWSMLITSAGLSIFTANPLPIMSFFLAGGVAHLKKKLETDNSYIQRVPADSLFPVYDSYPRPKYQTSKRQHNCFTWCREKLKIAEIILPEGDFERLVTLTRTYTNRGEFPFKMSCS